jgi:transmembrane sensor
MMRSNMSMERTHKIDVVASDWLIRRESGAWSAADQARLDEWLSASTLHRVAFLRLELAWADAARLKALGAGIPGDRAPPPGHWNLSPFFEAHSTVSLGDDPECVLTEPTSTRPTIEDSLYLATPGANPAPEDEAVQRAHRSQQVSEGRGDETADDSRHPPHRGLAFTPSPAAHHSKPQGLRRRRLALAAAATLLLAVGGGVYWAFAPNGERYATPVGGLASVPMADGSHVTLNTDSRVHIALTDTERRVELGRGEAYFEVSKDPSRPFVVRAGDKRVIAVGTKFSVRREGADIEIVVIEGKVRVQDDAAGLASRADGSADVFLTPGSIARADEAGVLVQRRTLPEAEEQLSWRTGWLLFRNQRLADAIAEFNRYNVRKIVIQDPAIGSLKIEGNFRATNVEAFVRLLESGFSVRAEVHADQIILAAK